MADTETLEGEIDEQSLMLPTREQRGLVRTQTSYQTAMSVQVPRDLKAVERRVIGEASAASTDFFYSWAVKNRDGTKGTVEGISIDGAMILARNWSNVVCPMSILEDSPTHWTFAATFIDLETGFSDERLFRQRKSERHGKFDDERALDIAFQIGQSKAKRNVIKRAIPAWLVERALDAAHAAAEKRYANVSESLAKVRPYFAKLKVTDEQLERKIGKKFADWLPRDVVQIRAIAKAIEDGQTNAAQEFSEDEPASAGAPAKTTADLAAKHAKESAPAIDPKAAPCTGDHKDPPCAAAACYLRGPA